MIAAADGLGPDRNPCCDACGYPYSGLGLCSWCRSVRVLTCDEMVGPANPAAGSHGRRNTLDLRGCGDGVVSEDCVRFGDRLRGLVEAGVAVKDAAVTLGISGHRCYAILRATGHPMGAARARRGRVDRERIVAVFTATGSIKAAAKASGIADSTARRVLVAEGLVDEAQKPRNKVQAKRRFLELIDSGWSGPARGSGGRGQRTHWPGLA